MNTKILTLDTDNFQASDLEEAAKLLRDGGLVAFPTETVYGLGANALDKRASSKIYAAKGRPSDNPLIVHIAHRKDMEELADEIPDKAYQLAEVFWPGPLTIILKKKALVPYETTGGLDTVAIRLPANSIARELIARSGVFVAAPSANISGKPSPTNAKHVINDLLGKVDMIIDGGKATLGLESTIVDLSEGAPMILRPGCITKAMLQNVIGAIEYDPAILTREPKSDIVPKAPGMKYRHYAPEGSLTIYSGELQAVTEAINTIAREKMECGYRVGIITTEETKHHYHYGLVKSIGSRKDEASIAAGLYGVLREFDELHTEYIYTESFSDNQFGQAIMNRLLKAAGYQVVKV
ncbi:MAG: threonylcarbamoyl-AMP synthase [Clostridiales bacterium]|jgi:L-threonylcarbamoyladenylate synthase|nr:threonylcarbamoyl-AMP synthase [Clostridiales bacterium]